jgi:LuxR family maltose regulon positive regulatory protein
VVAQHDLGQAVQWGNRVLEYSDTVPFYFRHLLMRLLIARGQKEAVPAQIRAFYESVQTEYLSPEWQRWLIASRIYQALAAPVPDEALNFLAEALVMAQPEGLVRICTDERILLAPLLRKAVSQGITPEYTARLLTIIEAEERQRKARKGEIPASSSASSLLSEREIEVLRLIEAGLSDRQIAENLFISLSTAKTHVRHILEKLNAESRSQAVARASEFKLI